MQSFLSHCILFLLHSHSIVMHTDLLLQEQHTKSFIICTTGYIFSVSYFFMSNPLNFAGSKTDSPIMVIPWLFRTIDGIIDVGSMHMFTLFPFRWKKKHSCITPMGIGATVGRIL